jgi:hypothetical protein
MDTPMIVTKTDDGRVTIILEVDEARNLRYGLLDWFHGYRTYKDMNAEKQELIANLGVALGYLDIWKEQT